MPILIFAVRCFTLRVYARVEVRQARVRDMSDIVQMMMAMIEILMRARGAIIQRCVRRRERDKKVVDKRFMSVVIFLAALCGERRHVTRRARTKKDTHPVA